MRPAVMRRGRTGALHVKGETVDGAGVLQGRRFVLDDPRHAVLGVKTLYHYVIDPA
jgi:hypothetical protein